MEVTAPGQDTRGEPMSSIEIDEETREIIDCFLTEGRESVEELELLLVAFEDSDGANNSSINSMFRIFHSVKGSAGYLDFGLVESVTHQAETIIQCIRDGQMPLTRKLVDCLCLVLDFLNDRFDAVQQTATDSSPEAEAAAKKLVAQLRAFLEPAQPAAAPAAVSAFAALATGHATPANPSTSKKKPLGELLLEQNRLDEEQLREALEMRHRPLGQILLEAGIIDEQGLNRALAIQRQLRESNLDVPLLGEILVQQELIDQGILQAALDERNKPLGEVLVELGVLTSGELKAALSAQTGIMPPQAPPARSAPAPTPAPAPAASPAPVKPSSRGNSSSSKPKRQLNETLRVDVRKLNSLMDLVGELIISATAIIHNPELADLDIESFQKSALQLGRVTRSLQDVAMSVRMVPIDATFRKMHRLVRDVSRKQGKEVDLRISGEETEVDKKVAEIIADPLVHLMRNAIDHGLEPVDERRQSGKAPSGIVRLEARHQGGEIWISISDDGRGIDRDRVLSKARERGLPDAHRDDLSDQQIYNFIFEPGFSTAQQLSDISGRGIGMDVVKKNIEKVKGRIDVSSRLGQGTTFTLRIPLTLAIIEGMLVRVGQSCFTIPLLQIKESVVVKASDITTLSDGMEIARIRDQLIPVVRLHQFYDLTPSSTDLEDGILVVVEDGGQTMSLFVDELIGQRQTVVKGLSGYLGDLPGLSGCTVLGDGRISLILDITSLMDCSSRSAA